MSVISNEIFETFRIQERAKEVTKAIRLLATQGFTILDLEDNIINKSNINDEKRHSVKYNYINENRHNIKYNRTPKKIADESSR
tara:strand:+ start:2158 stop:2409 length:252 start_codon:yes stop_codon:yes gene_type:complete